jgi:hypothetical protein
MEILSNVSPDFCQACEVQGRPLEKLHEQLSFVTPRVRTQTQSSDAPLGSQPYQLEFFLRTSSHRPRAGSPDRLLPFSDVDGRPEAGEHGLKTEAVQEAKMAEELTSALESYRRQPSRKKPILGQTPKLRANINRHVPHA